MKVLFIKVHPDAKRPVKAHPGEDAGFDIYSVEDVFVKANIPTIINIGIRIALPEEYYAEIHTRSSHGLKGIRNHLGVVDNGYRGDVSPIMISNNDIQIKKGEKVGQLIIKKIEDAEFVEVDKLPDSKRGKNGFGSTGK